MIIYLLEAEHHTVNGRLIQLHRDKDRAIREAVKLCALMRDDSIYQDRIDAPTTDNWEEVAAQLSDIHGAAHCYVEITEKEFSS